MNKNTQIMQENINKKRLNYLTKRNTIYLNYNRKNENTNDQRE